MKKITNEELIKMVIKHAQARIIFSLAGVANYDLMNYKWTVRKNNFKLIKI